MSDSRPLSLTQRVERLERETRRWKIGTVIAVLSGSWFFLSWGPDSVTEQVVTKRLVVVDEAGERRAELNATKSIPALYLTGRDGVDRVWLEVAVDGPRLVFRDERKRQRLVLGGFNLYPDSGPTEVRPTSSLVLMTEDGKFWKAP
jgi:hypothetical protein